MKACCKLLVVTAVLSLLIGCRKEKILFDGTSVNGTIQDAGGVTWSVNDSIGVASNLKGNYRFVLDSKHAGKYTGSFSGNMSADELPASAYYPYTPSAGSTAMETVSMTLPGVQISDGNGPDISLDVRVAGKPDGSVAEGFTFKFVRKLAGIRIDIVPDSEMDGKTLSGVSFGAKEKTLAGKFNLKLQEPSSPLSFTESLSEVNNNFSVGKKFCQGDTVTVYFLVNPDVAKGDSIFLTLPLDDRAAIVKITSDQTIEAGKNHTFTFNIAELRDAGKIYIEKGEGTVFTNIKKYGVFDFSKGVITGIFTYTEGEDQYSAYSNVSYTFYSITNLDKGKAVKIRVLKSASKLNETYDVNCSSAGLGIANTAYKANLVKVDGNMYWFEDKTDKLGFIIYK